MNVVEEGAALCVPFLRHLPVDGVSISVVSVVGAHSTVATSDRVAALLEDLQFELGEGPTSDTMRHGLFVSALDLHAAGVREAWPVFAAAAAEAGVCALFAFPMLLHGARVGAVNLYAREVRPLWSPVLMQQGADLTASVAPVAVELATRAALADPLPGGQQIELRREVHQAAGMLMVQLHCSIEDATARLRAHAFAQSTPIDAIARSVVEGTLRLDGLDE